MLALALLAAVPWTGILAMGAAVIGIVLAAGAIAGQFRRGVVGELRDSLSTAKTEIDIERSRSDRLEQEAKDLRREVVALRAEVATLRSVLTDDRKLAQLVAQELAETRRGEVDEIIHAVAQSCAHVMEAINELKGGKDG